MKSEKKKTITRRDFLRRTSAFAGASLLAACAQSSETEQGAETGSSTPNPTALPAAAEAVTLDYWYWADSPSLGEFFRGVLDDFNSSHENIEIVGGAQPAYQAAREKLVATAAAGGGGPDVTYANLQMAFEFLPAGISRPVQNYFDNWAQKDDLFSSLIETHKRPEGDRQLVYLPIGLEVMYHYRRLDLYEAAGLEAPVFFDDLLEYSRALTDAPDTYGFGLRGADGSGLGYNLFTYLASHDIVFSDGEGGTTLDSETAIEVATKVAELYWDGIAQPSALQDRFPQMVALMQEGKIAQWSAANLHSAIMLDGWEEGESLLGASPMPRGGEEYDQWTGITSAGNLMMNETEHPDEAWELMAFFDQPENIERYCKASGFAPPTQSAARQPFFRENRFQQLSTDLAESWSLFPEWHPNWAEVKIAQGPQLWQRVLLKEIAPEEMLQTLADLMREV